MNVVAMLALTTEDPQLYRIFAHFSGFAIIEDWVLLLLLLLPQPWQKRSRRSGL